MIRKLGNFEQAAVVSNIYAPFNVIIVVRLANAPSPDLLRSALDQIQNKHALLRAKIVDSKYGLIFQESSNPPPIQLTILEQDINHSWRSIVQNEMAFRFDINTTPLIRTTYLQNGNNADLVICAHHAILDGATGISLVEDLIKRCAGIDDEIIDGDFELPGKNLLPVSHQGWNKIKQLIKYGYAQLSEETRFWRQNLGNRIPKVFRGGKGRVFSITLSEDLAEALVRQGREKGITLNSILNCAQLLAVSRILYKSKLTRLATISFADLRPYLHSPIPPAVMGAWVSLVRIFLDVEGNMAFWPLVEKMQQKINQSFTEGEKISAYLASEGLMKLMTRLDKIRLGASAVNYSGVIPLKPRYGKITIRSVHGFVSGYDLAPEMSSQARLFKDKILWDFIYLDTDMDEKVAFRIVNEIQHILRNAVNH